MFSVVKGRKTRRTVGNDKQWVPSSGQDGREEMEKALMPSVGAL
jgi:hypothetical protein